MIMKLWIARSELCRLCLYITKPKKEKSRVTGTIYWTDGNISFNIDDRLFPEITFENSPQEIELKLIKEL